MAHFWAGNLMICIACVVFFVSVPDKFMAMFYVAAVAFGNSLAGFPLQKWETADK